MGVRHSYVKNVCKQIMREHPELVSIDFERNKEFLNKYVEFYSKDIRNKIAGCLVTYKKREGVILIPPYKGKPKKMKGWKKKDKIKNRRKK
jgi:ribosomal protein S17E